jgi:hypothetical protein
MKISDELHVKLKRGSKSAYEAYGQLIVEEVLRSIPHVIEAVCKQTLALRRLSEDFYRKNPDLEPHREKIPKVLEQVEAENPGISPDRLVEIGSHRMRSFLDETKKANAFIPKDGSSPFAVDKKLGEL